MTACVIDGCLGVEGTAAGTVGLLVDRQDRVLRRVEAGPGHLKLLAGARLPALFDELARLLPKPATVAIGMAGASSVADFSRIRAAALEIWPHAPCLATSEFEIVRAAVNGFQSNAADIPSVVTAGSACFGQGRGGRAARVGGWGHWLGDKASGYDLGLRALKAVLYRYDQDGTWPPLGRRLLQVLQLNEPSDLIGWVQSAPPSEIRRLGVEVMLAWGRRDRIAADIVAGASAHLAINAATCARRIARAKQPVDFLFARGFPLNDNRFAARLTREVKRLWPSARLKWSRREPAWGAVELARSLVGRPSLPQPPAPKARTDAASPTNSGGRLSPTEQRHPRSRQLDRMPLRNAIRLMLSEDAKIPGRLLAEAGRIEQAVRAIARAFRNRGRLFYVGAGTSGRLGVLDASECPPTFRSDPETVQGIIAGGAAALSQSIEGAEDDGPAGKRALEMRGVGSRDVVVGLAASGTTPFVWGALNHAIRKRATSILVCFNPHLVIPRGARPSIVIAPNLGPEILTGSTRLKAGTATKLLLNIFTTLAMVRVGKVASNLMVDLQPSNAKLRNRAVRIVQELANTDAPTAQAVLESSRWNIKKAISRLR